MTDFIHISSSEPTPRALKDHCEDHPYQTTVNSEVGYGLAGGGMGVYFICGVCGSVFGKEEDNNDD